MSTTDVTTEESETDRVVRWRAERLEHAGYDVLAAREIAARFEIDLHRAIQLLENGCSAETAARILL
jgi:hypothetical protein